MKGKICGFVVLLLLMPFPVFALGNVTGFYSPVVVSGTKLYSGIAGKNDLYIKGTGFMGSGQYVQWEAPGQAVAYLSMNYLSGTLCYASVTDEQIGRVGETKVSITEQVGGVWVIGVAKNFTVLPSDFVPGAGGGGPSVEEITALQGRLSGVVSFLGGCLAIIGFVGGMHGGRV